MKVVVDRFAWLDANELTQDQRKNLRRSLTIHPRKTSRLNKKDPAPIILYEERPRRKLFGVPRAFYSEHVTTEHTEVVKVCHGKAMGEFESNYTADGPYDEQHEILNRLMKQTEGREWGGFLFKAGCGTGKTEVALEFARRLGRKTLILVHKEFLMKQWVNRIRKLYPGSKVGIIRQNTCDVQDKDFVVAMLKSLWKDEEGKKYPQSIYTEEFGLLIGDEIHRVAAATWAPVIPRFNAAWRLGLTATDRRLDGAENVFRHHVGPVAYAAKTRAIIPKLRKVYTDFHPHDIKRGSYFVAKDDLNNAQLLTQMGQNPFRSRQIVEEIVQALRNGRKIMVVSERLENLRDIASDLTNSLMVADLDYTPIIDFYTGDWFTAECDSKGNQKKKRRTEEELYRAESANVLLATKQLCEEGLDIPAIDVEILATPMSDPEQTVGRERRWCFPDIERHGVDENGVSLKCLHFCPWRAGKCKAKPDPILVDVIDENVEWAVHKWNRRRRWYTSVGIS